jgi:hypothetical protein
MEVATEAHGRRGRVGGVLIVTYWLILLHGFGLLRAMLPRGFWLARLEHRWIELWMR